MYIVTRAEPGVHTVAAHRGDLDPVPFEDFKVERNAWSFISFLNGNPRIDLADLLFTDAAGEVYAPIKPKILTDRVRA